MSTHWHDTPMFAQIRDARIASVKSTDDDEGSQVCRHGGLDYFMRGPRTGEGHFMYRACCEENVELELLTLSAPPAACDED